MDNDPHYVLNMTKNQRLELIANLIVDKIIEDQKQGYPLLKRIQTEEKNTLNKHPRARRKKANLLVEVQLDSHS